MKLIELIERIVKKASGSYLVKSESGKNLGGVNKKLSLKQAKKRLAQVEYFKHHG